MWLDDETLRRTIWISHKTNIDYAYTIDANKYALCACKFKKNTDPLYTNRWFRGFPIVIFHVHTSTSILVGICNDTLPKDLTLGWFSKYREIMFHILLTITWLRVLHITSMLMHQVKRSLIGVNLITCNLCLLYVVNVQALDLKMCGNQRYTQRTYGATDKL